VSFKCAFGWKCGCPVPSLPDQRETVGALVNRVALAKDARSSACVATPLRKRGAGHPSGSLAELDCDRALMKATVTTGNTPFLPSGPRDAAVAGAGLPRAASLLGRWAGAQRGPAPPGRALWPGTRGPGVRLGKPCGPAEAGGRTRGRRAA